MLRLSFSISALGYCSMVNCDDFPKYTVITQDQTLKLTCLILAMYFFTKPVIDDIWSIIITLKG